MPTRSLPTWPNLEHLKNQAKDLLKSYRAGQPPALVRIREALPRLSAVPDDRLALLSLSLRDAQRVVAAEHGFASWSDLRTHIERRENIQMLEVTIDQIRMSPSSHQRIVVLKAKGVDRCLPIWIGSAEADSISLKLEGKEFPRPMTHDLMDSMINDLGATVTRVIVSELREDTFIARVVLQRNGTTIERDSRPSDAIALAVRCGATIFAEEDVLERGGVALDPDTGEPDSADARWPAFSAREQGDALSEDTRSLLTQAGVEAERLGRKAIEPEDMLLALVGEAGGLGAKVMSDLGADLQVIRTKLDDRSGSGDPAHHTHDFPSIQLGRACRSRSRSRDAAQTRRRPVPSCRAPPTKLPELAENHPFGKLRKARLRANESTPFFSVRNPGKTFDSSLGGCDRSADPTEPSRGCATSAARCCRARRTPPRPGGRHRRCRRRSSGKPCSSSPSTPACPMGPGGRPCA